MPADFAADLAPRRAAAGLSLAHLAKRAHLHRGYATNVEHGHRWPTETVARALDSALDAGGELLATWEAANRTPRRQTRSADEHSVELLELAARAEASDVSATTLDLLDSRVDTMARLYARATRRTAA
jgi:transcriptional regulator with XRE-family HTH domain